MTISENGVSFFGAGGHSHNGVNSTLIDTNSYSIFDFKLGYVGSPTRISAQQTNMTALEDWVVRTINSKVLQPAGITLSPNTLNGKSIQVNTITAVQLQANTITADEIAANTITANELVSNIVLVNNSIQSAVYSTGSSGWRISNTGSAEFNDVTVRGNIFSGSGTIGRFAISNTDLVSSDVTNPNYRIALYGNGRVYITTVDGSQDRQMQLFGQNLRILNNRYNINGSPSYYSLLDSDRLEFYVGGGLRSYIYSNADSQNTTIYNPSLITIDAPNVSVSGYVSSYTGNENNNSNPARVWGTNGSDDKMRTYTTSALSVSYASTAGTANFAYCGNNQVPVRATYNTSTSVGIMQTGSSTTARLSTGDSGNLYQEVKAPTSRRALKENIQDINNALEIINSIRPRKFNWKINAFNEQDPFSNEDWSDEAKQINELSFTYGFIAEEIFEDRPDLAVLSHQHPEIPRDQPGGLYDLNSWEPIMWKEIDLIPISVKAIQEISQRLESIESRLKALEEV